MLCKRQEIDYEKSMNILFQLAFLVIPRLENSTDATPKINEHHLEFLQWSLNLKNLPLQSSKISKQRQ